MFGLRLPYIDWPYVEGLRIDEAMHPLTLLTVGLYGETLPNQNGAPVRMIMPWKYGFKSGKSIVKIDFVEQMPVTAWMKAGADRIRLLRQREPGRGPSALEPEEGARAAGPVLQHGDQALQRLCRPGRLALCRAWT